MTRRVSSDRIVGRGDEIRLGRLTVDSLFAPDAQRRIPLLLVSGEAGIGKTRLLQYLLDEVVTRGGLTACGRCLEHGGEIRPLNSIVEILTELVPLAAGVGVALDPELAPLVTGADAGEPTALSRWPARLDGQVRALLHDVADRRPLVIAVEDVHWADRTTRDLLVTLLRSRGLERVLFICTYRSDELHRRHPLLPVLAEIERTTRYERIDLVPLDDDEVAELAAAITGETTADAIGRELASRCGGNPFYAEEILAAGPARGRLPEGVRHVVLARSQTLGTDALQCIESASTLAAPVDSVVLRSTTELDGDRYRAAIDELCRERFLVETRSGFSFRHDLVREVFLDELLPGERMALFARAADSLERHQPSRLGEIARLRVAAAQLDLALRASMAAAVAAESIGAVAEASECYNRALDIWPRVDEPETLAACSHLELLRRSARAADLSRDFDQAMELGRLAAAEAADGDPVVEGAVLYELCKYTWNSSAPGLDDVIDRALEVLPIDPPSVERARMEIRRANRLRLRGEDEASDVLLRRAAETARVLGEGGVEADARATLAYDRAVFGDELALAEVYEALALALASDAGEVVTKLYVNLANTLLFMGRFEQLAQVSRDGADAAERYGLLGLHGILVLGNGLQGLEPLGRWDEAAAIVDDINRRHGAESVHLWASALVGWAQVEVQRGNYEAAASVSRRGFELQSSGYYSGDLPQLGTVLIEVAAAGVVPPVSIDTVDSWFQRLPPNEASWTARLAAVSAHRLVPPAPSRGHRPAAEAVEAWIERVRRTVAEHYTVAPPVLDVWLEQAGAELAAARGEHPVSAWARLASEWDALGCPFFAARARYRQADALLMATGGRGTGDKATATALLSAAARTTEQLGAEPLRHEITDLARRARLELSTSGTDQPAVGQPDDSPFGLTQRELEVLRLMVDGRSNGEIGAQLFVSRKTASVHVSNILRKLGAANRIEAAAIARRHEV